MRVALTVDDTQHTIEMDATESLYHAIVPFAYRNSRCPDGRCMRCLVVLNDRVVNACAVPIFRAHSGTVYTYEGLSADPIIHDIHRAFERVGLDTCGEAYRSLVLLAYSILQRDTNPSEMEVNRVSRHLTDRCSNRDDFERAVRLAAGLLRRKAHEQSNTTRRR